MASTTHTSRTSGHTSTGETASSQATASTPSPPSTSETGSSQATPSQSTASPGTTGATSGSSSSTASSGPGPDAGGCRWCACKTYDAQSCTDFDESPNIPAGWAVAADAGTIGVVSTLAESLPNSLGAALLKGPSISSTVLVQGFGAAAGASTMVLRFDLLVESCAVPNYDAVAEIAFGGVYDPAVLLLPTSDGGPLALGAGVIVHGGGSAGTVPSKLIVKPGTWTPVLATIDVGSATISVSETGAPDGSAVSASGFSSGADVSLEMGLVVLNGTCNVYIDNVTFAWTP